MWSFNFAIQCWDAVIHCYNALGFNSYFGSLAVANIGRRTCEVSQAAHTVNIVDNTLFNVGWLFGVMVSPLDLR